MCSGRWNLLMHYVFLNLERIVSPALVPSTREIQYLYGKLCSPIGILPNLSIELGGKTMLITITIMHDLVDYNIVLRCDYIYAMQVVVSSPFRVMTFPHEGHIIIIDKLS